VKIVGAKPELSNESWSVTRVIIAPKIGLRPAPVLILRRDEHSCHESWLVPLRGFLGAIHAL
jgi:hypothetical protein